ncbi:MAG: hypothetical protein J0M08_10950 [Bacteroidetes bacterium]|nr:hypothetical protein [Bacteroidota bacterium]
MRNFTKSSALLGALALAGSSFAQLQDEKNVTITMDLQPVLQLKMEGPDQLDFTFDEISEYYAGITKYGATQLKVSASVSWDLWAAGLSQGNVANFCWDNQVQYQAATGGVDEIPITALELHQFPANPAIAATCANTIAQSSDYSRPFQIRSAANVVSSNNTIYAPSPASPYSSPTSTGVLGTSEKYIAGGTGTIANCQIAGGSYLLNSTATLAAGSYYYVLDYRILPGLPVVFPAHDDATTINTTAAYVTNADGATTLIDTATDYAQPGVYTMYVKYILTQDQ